MTPIVNNIARRLMRGEIQRHLVDRASKILSATFFDISGVTDVVFDEKWTKINRPVMFDLDYMFLPAASTWMEFNIPLARRKIVRDDPRGFEDNEFIRALEIIVVRKGVLIEFHDEAFHMLLCDEVDGKSEDIYGRTRDLHRIPLIDDMGLHVVPLDLISREIHLSANPQHDEDIALLYLLNLMNQPYLTDTESQPPHRATVRELMKRKSKVLPKGSNIITLKKGVTAENIETVARQARITGKRIYHFVRGHYKPIAKKQIASYWRGDKEIGTKPMPDYIVKP